MKKVLLICMPFATTTHPAIGISLLKARLREEGIGCDIRYLNIPFAQAMGRDRYERFGGCQGDNTMMREWLFARRYFGDRIPGREEYACYLQGLYGCEQLPAGPLPALLELERLVGPFLEECMRSVSWEDYDVVGFTTMFEQNMVALCLARLIKELAPEKTVVFGGANCEGELGLALHRNFGEIDYVCSGEADYTFPELVKRVRSGNGNGAGLQDLPGIVYRDRNGSHATDGIAAVEDLDRLPYPDYDDYFGQLADTPAEFQRPPQNYGSPLGIPMESSRGCWWGQKSQCRFCSLNRGAIRYRSKSQQRVLKEMEALSRRYGADQLFMVDNILDLQYFKELIPELGRGPLKLQLFYETKSNLNREQVALLGAAGINCIQPGIESLNSHVLQLMKKGVSALQNIQFLKHCAEFDVYPGWSIITGFPGETAEDYREMIRLIDKLVHLHPPNGNARFSLQRFSPFFADPERHGIVNVRPDGVYRFIYPFDGDEVAALAYYFEFDYSDEVRPPDLDLELSYATSYWKECHDRQASLTARPGPGQTLILADTRPGASCSQLVLEPAQQEVYSYCQQIRSFAEIFAFVRESYPAQAARSRDLRDFLEDLVALDLMISEGDRYLSLAVPGGGAA